MKETLRVVIKEQQKQRNNPVEVERAIPQELIDTQEILVISGVRRCGKSVLMQQIRRKQTQQNYFLNFDDERLVNFQVEHFQLLQEVFAEMYGEQNTYYFDEIQNIAGWERFVRRLYDSGNKIFITGSNASMLSRELGTHLTGRYVRFELYPFSFREYIEFHHKKLPSDDIFATVETGMISGLFRDYMKLGGIPIYLKSRQELYLKQLYESVLYKDVLVRNKLTNERELLQLVYFLASNVARLFSYKTLCQVVGIKNPTTISNYISFIENTYLVFQVSKFDYSLKSQLINPKKIYFIDNALTTRLGFNFSENQGRMLENAVFIELKRRGLEVFYHQGKGECDFVVRNGFQISQAYQVCVSPENEMTRQREIAGLLDAMKCYQLQSGTLLTLDTDETIEAEGLYIKVLPVWKWMLERKQDEAGKSNE